LFPPAFQSPRLDPFQDLLGRRALVEGHLEVLLLSVVVLARPTLQLVREGNLAWQDGKATLTLDAEDVAVVELP
jgi:hypothetical protein